MERLLFMDHISKSFPGVKALDDVNIDIYPGEVHALVGENGAGKSTLMKILNGVYQPDKGNIFVNGEKQQITSTKIAQQLGISIVFQEFNLCNAISVANNIFIGRHKKNAFGLVDDKWLFDETMKIMEYMKLSINPNAIVGSLSVAEKQLVEIAKAISTDSKIIVFDEPTSALTDREIERLFEIIKMLKKEGRGIFYISHRMEELDRIADRITILRDGKHIHSCNYKDITKDDMIRMMVGRELNNQYPSDVRTIGDVIFEIESVKVPGLLNIEGIEVREGEIVGFAGLAGAGRTETARAIFGADKSSELKLKINGEDISIRDPKSAINFGIGYLTDDRKNSGLALRLDIEKNINMTGYSMFKKFGLYSQKLADENAEKYVKSVNIKTPSIRQLTQNLSGGNQQKVVLSKWLSKDTKILIFDEPTRGIDVGAKYEIYKLMNEMSEKKKGIIMISSDLPEILGMCDRVYVFCKGKISGMLTRDEMTQERILRLATGVQNSEEES